MKHDLKIRAQLGIHKLGFGSWLMVHKLFKVTNSL